MPPQSTTPNTGTLKERDEVWAAAIADDRALVTENVQDFRRIEANALAHAGRAPDLHHRPTVPQRRPRNPRPPRQHPRRLLAAEPDVATALFLKPATSA
jgi:hypothetical protein